VGVVVLKRPVGDLETSFPPKSLGMVLDPQGILVMDNRPNMILRGLWPLSPTTEEHLVASRQF
jgi:C4-dicarboxylate-specific signal transduction histidine kinase